MAFGIYLIGLSYKWGDSPCLFLRVCTLSTLDLLIETGDQLTHLVAVKVPGDRLGGALGIGLDGDRSLAESGFYHRRMWAQFAGQDPAMQGRRLVT